MDTDKQNSVNKDRDAKRNLAIAILAVALAVIVGSGVWYWQQQTIDARNSRVNTLESQVETLNQEKEELAVAAEDKEKEEEKEKEKPDKRTVYKAEVGKFTLTLPSKYKVVQRNDGGGEGGPSTQILLAEETDDPGVYTSSIWDKFEVTAIPLQTVSFRDRVNGKLRNANVIEESTTTINGVKAEVYKVGGLGTSKKIYFTNNGIFYSIDMGSDSDAANQRLEDVKDGFQFND